MINYTNWWYLEQHWVFFNQAFAITSKLSFFLVTRSSKQFLFFCGGFFDEIIGDILENGIFGRQSKCLKNDDICIVDSTNLMRNRWLSIYLFIYSFQVLNKVAEQLQKFNKNSQKIMKYYLLLGFVGCLFFIFHFCFIFARFLRAPQTYSVVQVVHDFGTEFDVVSQNLFKACKSAYRSNSTR